MLSDFTTNEKWYSFTYAGRWWFTHSKSLYCCWRCKTCLSHFPWWHFEASKGNLLHKSLSFSFFASVSVNKHLRRCWFKQDIIRQASVNALSRSKKKALLASLDEFTEQMPSLLEIDHPCARRQITEARQIVEVCESFKFCMFVQHVFLLYELIWRLFIYLFCLHLNSIWLFSFGDWVK